MLTGGWRKVENIDEMISSIAIEFGNHTYAKALDNGLFILGPPHDEGKVQHQFLIEKYCFI